MMSGIATRSIDRQVDQSTGSDYCSRALALWPRLERHKLTRIKHDPGRLAALIARRTTLPEEAILELLGAPDSSTRISG